MEARRRTERDMDQKKSDLGTVNSPLQLTEEEKAVLMECRTNSIARGVAATAGSLVVLRALIATGRVPHHVQRWSSVYYTSLGAVAFLVGMRSYRQQCFDKIMALEHSVLADQLRQHRRKQQGWTEEAVMLPPPRLPSSTPSPSHSPHSPPPHDTVPSDKHFSSTGLGETAEDQPSAFGDITTPPLTSSGSPQVFEVTPTVPIRGRTFNEIRDENRRRQHQRHSPQTRAGGVRGEGSSKPVHVRRNKYGDIVSED